MTETSDADRAKAAAEEIVRTEWLNAVDTGAIADYGSQEAVHTAMTHMADAIAAALAAERAAAERRLIHLKQAGALASFAEDLEQEGEPRAAVMADQLAEFYRQWAEDPDVVPPEREAPPERAAAVADLRARVEAVAEAMEESGTLYFAARIRDALRAAVTDTTGGTQ